MSDIADLGFKNFGQIFGAFFFRRGEGVEDVDGEYVGSEGNRKRIENEGTQQGIEIGSVEVL